MSKPLFESVLIANRGEIACRIIKTVNRLGIRSIAVYHHEDRGAPHVALADEAIELAGDVPSGAYLDIDQIVDKARDASAIHPGYGFLAENAAFAEAVESAGITFIGPTAESIGLMGDKLRSREFARAAGIPISPSVEQTGDIASFIKDAEAIGFPILIKAAAGGGGKGMSIVHSADDLGARAEIAAKEAERYFADGRIYAEQYIERPRHIEVQVLGDGRGKVLHLFERECSIQRRFQKIIEESPATSLDVKLRDRICEAGVKLASEARYRNAGTVEFMLAPDDTFYFLEMNTRLQVEHPVTEMTTGLDLVEEQLRIANGEGLRHEQRDIAQTGHAIECRICAEEPDHDFRPATGMARFIQEPDGEGIRFDGGIREGQTISASFDSMLAKLIVHADDRETAVDKATAALQSLVLLGVDTNIDYLGRILEHAAFHQGKLHTGFVVEHAADLKPPELDPTDRAAVLLAAALGIDEFRRIAYEVPEPYASIGPWRN
jgi:propionyl-CoA carboxylase alpha chain/3-methylcrotonyl-CoA carboxylase alpha subunit/acetyl-CoA/propionyl-CoA carboxylase biotin carboxyl carrier protein